MRARAIKRATEALATTDEVAEALAALSKADIARLSAIARIRAHYAPGLDWRDLLHGAIERSLDGTRRWPRNLPFFVFLREVMRSQASEYRRKTLSGPVRVEADLLSGEAEAQLLAAASDDPDPQREVAARQALASIRTLFEGDAAVLAIIEGLGQGHTPEETQEIAGITVTQYASAQRRIRRGLARAFPEGIS